MNILRIFPTGIALEGQLQFASCSLKELNSVQRSVQIPIRNNGDPPLESIRSEQQERFLKGVPVTVKDLQTAELLLIKEVQRQAFPAEVKALETYKKEQRSEIHGRERKMTKGYQAPFIALI